MTATADFPSLFVVLCGACSIIAVIPLAGITWQIFPAEIMVGGIKLPEIQSMEKILTNAAPSLKREREIVELSFGIYFLEFAESYILETTKVTIPSP